MLFEMRYHMIIKFEFLGSFVQLLLVFMKYTDFDA